MCMILLSRYHLGSARSALTKAALLGVCRLETDITVVQIKPKLRIRVFFLCLQRKFPVSNAAGVWCHMTLIKSSHASSNSYLFIYFFFFAFAIFWPMPVTENYVLLKPAPGELSVCSCITPQELEDLAKKHLYMKY